MATTISSDIWTITERYSNLTRLLRITSLCKRVIMKFRQQSAPSFDTPITTNELNEALHHWVSVTQLMFFSKELQTLEGNSVLPKGSPLKKLTPFIDHRRILRLGGRLRFSQLDSNEKHPMILPRHSRLTTLIIRHHHHVTLHGGTQLTLASIRRQFWILGGRAPIRSFIQRCLVCVRHRAQTQIQQMGQLLASRVNPSRPFSHTGVDYAGPSN